LIDRVAELVWPAEFADNFSHIPVPPEGGNLEDVRERELEFAIGGVFFEQVVQDVAGFGGGKGEC
jgi:hypothetical protein